MEESSKDWDVIVIENKLISGAIADEYFLCNLAACKGACCVEGDAGAPLEEGELSILEEIFTQIAPYLAEKGKKAIERQGKYTRNQGEYVTPLVEKKECAYATFDPNGTAKCGIEQAYLAGEIAFRKPISCHLYPIRISEKNEFEFMNYDEWDICSPACSNGKHAKLKIYEFAKAAIVRKYGESFFQELKETLEARDQLLDSGEA